MQTGNDNPKRSSASYVLDTAVLVGTLTGIGLVVLIVFVILFNAFPAIQSVGIGEFLSNSTWSPTSEPAKYGIWSLIVGSFAVAIGSVIIALPVAVAFSCFLNYYSGRASAFIGRRVVELLSGIPSIVLGLWGLTVLAPLINRIQPPGASLLTAVLTLALMVIPTIVITLDSAMQNCRRDLMEACKSLAISKETYLVRIVFRQVRPAMIAGTVLALTRAIGETMVVVMASGNVIQIPGSPFEPIRTVTANLALEVGYADPMHRSALFFTSLLLLAATGLLILLVSIGRVAKGKERRI